MKNYPCLVAKNYPYLVAFAVAICYGMAQKNDLLDFKSPKLFRDFVESQKASIEQGEDPSVVLGRIASIKLASQRRAAMVTLGGSLTDRASNELLSWLERDVGRVNDVGKEELEVLATKHPKQMLRLVREKCPERAKLAGITEPTRPQCRDHDLCGMCKVVIRNLLHHDSKIGPEAARALAVSACPTRSAPLSDIEVAMQGMCGLKCDVCAGVVPRAFRELSKLSTATALEELERWEGKVFHLKAVQSVLSVWAPKSPEDAHAFCDSLVKKFPKIASKVYAELALATGGNGFELQKLDPDRHSFSMALVKLRIDGATDFHEVVQWIAEHKDSDTVTMAYTVLASRWLEKDFWEAVSWVEGVGKSAVKNRLIAEVLANSGKIQGTSKQYARLLVLAGGSTELRSLETPLVMFFQNWNKIDETTAQSAAGACELLPGAVSQERLQRVFPENFANLGNQ